MTATITESYYLRCPPCFEPSGLRFDAPGRFQGQTIEHAFAGVGAPWKRVSDRSNGSTYYAQRYMELRTARAVRTFGDGSNCRRFRVALGTGTVEAWDVVADHWTTCHSLTARQIAALRAAARDAA